LVSPTQVDQDTHKKAYSIAYGAGGVSAGEARAELAGCQRQREYAFMEQQI
jgi:hypothetical protein